MAVNKITGFRAPYKSDTFRDIVDSIEGLHGVLDMGGAITQVASTITVPPFRVVQDGLIFEKTVATTLTAPSMSAPYYLVVTAPTPNPIDDLLFTFAKTPEDVSDSEVILGAYDGFEWREAQKVSVAGLLDLLRQTNIDTLRTGPFDGLRTSLNGSNYENTKGTLVDQLGETQRFSEKAIFPVVAVDPDWSRVDRIVYRRPTDYVPRIGTREFLLGGTYDSTPAALTPVESFDDSFVRQAQKVLIGSDNAAHILSMSGSGTVFRLDYTKIASDRLSALEPAATLFSGIESNSFGAAIDPSDNIHIVYVKSGNICYRKFDSSGGSLVSETVIDTQSGACAHPRVSIDPAGTKVFVVYQALLGPNNNQIFFTARTLAGTLVTAPKNLTGSAQNLITPDIFVSEDLYAYVVWENDTLGSIVYRRFDDIGNALDTAATTVSTGVEQIGVGTLTGSASDPRVLVTANRELIIAFRQDKGGSTYGVSVYTGGAAFMQELTGPSESILSFDIATDPIFNSIMLTLVQASSVDFVKVYGEEVAFVLNLSSDGSRGVAVARDQLGSLLHAVAGEAAGTYTSYDASGSIIAFGAASVVGAVTTINVDSNQFLVLEASLSDVPDIDDRVVITGSGIGGNNATRLITNVELLSLDAIDDVYRVTVQNNFTAAEEPSSATGDFQAPDGNNAVYVKTVSEAQSKVFGLFELPSDVLLSRIVAPGAAILNWLPPGSAGDLADFLVIGGTGTVDWEKTAPGELTFSGTVKLTNIFTATEYQIAAGSYPMIEGDALYVSLDPSELNPTPLVTPVPTLPWNEEIGVIGIIVGGKFEPSMANLRPLISQEEMSLGENLSVSIRDRLGLVDDVDFEPFTSTEHIESTDNYQEAISNLDTAVQNIMGQIQMGPMSPISKKVAVSGVDKTLLKGSIFGIKYKDRLVDFDGAIIDFSSGSITEVDGTTPLGENFTPVVPAAGTWRWYAVNLLPGSVTSENKLSVKLKVTAAGSNGATQADAPRATFTNQPDVGQVAVFSSDGVSISNIDYSNLVNLLTNFSTSEGSGGSGAQILVSGDFEYDWGYTSVVDFSFSPGLRFRDLAIGVTWTPVGGSFTMSEGQAIYIVLDTSNLTPTPQVTALTTLPTTENILVIGAIRDGDFVPAVSNLETLVPGERRIFGESLSERIKTRLGVTDDASYEAYSSNSQMGVNNSYPEALSNLDAVITKILEQIQIQPMSANSSRVAITGAYKTLYNGSILGMQVENLLVEFDGAEIDFQTGEIFEADGTTPLGLDFTPVVPAAGQWRWFAINLESTTPDSENKLQFRIIVTPAAADGASQSAAVRAEFDSGPKVGQVAITSSDGSTVSDISNSNIINLLTLDVGSGGGSTILKAPAGVNLSENDLVYLSPGNAAGDTGRTQGSIYLVDAGNSTPALAAIRSQAVGFCQAAALSGADVKVSTGGLRKNFSGLTPGVQYYADPSTPGAITATKPTTVGQWAVPIGVPRSATQLDINPSSNSDAAIVTDIAFVSSLTAGENLAIRDLVYISPGNASGDTGRTAGRVYKVDAGNANAALALIRSQAVGFVQAAALSGATALVQKTQLLSGFSSLSTGAQHYADPAVPGAITATKPSADGQWVVPVGVASSATVLDINPSMSSDAEIVEVVASPTDFDATQTAHGFTVGQAVYFDGTNWQLAKADSAYTMAEGIVKSVTDVNNFTVRVVGPVEGLSGLTAGAYYFVSKDTAGALTATEPTAPYFSNPVGFALSTTQLMVLPLRPAVGGPESLSYYYTATAGENLTAGDLVYLSPGTAQGDTTRTQGRLYKCDPGNANAALAAIRARAIGVCTVTALSGVASQAQLAGSKNGFVGLTPGVVYYADPSTPGALTATKPTTVGYWVVPVGFGTSVTELWINPAMAARGELIEAPATDPIPTTTYTAGETLATNDVVYVSPGNGAGDTGRTQGQAYKCDAGNANATLAAIRSQAVGVVQTGVSSGATVTVQSSRSMSGFVGLTPGLLYYVNPSTPGAVTSTKPTTLGYWVVPVGVALTATSVLVNPSMAADSAVVALQSGVETITGTAGENLTANDLVYMSVGNAGGDTGRTAGSFYKVDAGHATLAAFRSYGIGFVQATVLSGASVTVQRNGPLSGFVGLTAGVAYYANPSSAGAITATRPVTLNQYVVPVGFARSSTDIQINPAIPSDVEIIAASGGGLSSPVAKTGAYNLVDGDRIIANTSGGAFTLTLPAAPSIGDEVEIWDGQSTWGTNNLTVARNGSQIEGTATDLICNVSGGKVQLVYMAGSRGWGVFT